jgi:tetratricopeptide (TPR) repeat protein
MLLGSLEPAAFKEWDDRSMGEIERLVADADDGTVDDEFLRHLYRGGELLSSGQVEEARAPLERAYELHPKNPKAQNLLGLAYFKLGVFDKAAEIYEILVRDNPVDPTLRVNLGLVYLKQNALNRATREFETAVDLSPDHKKAQNYLGLAYAQTGEYNRAKDCFVAAGSLSMVEKMERALRDSQPDRVEAAPLGEGAQDGVGPIPPATPIDDLEPQGAEPFVQRPAAEEGRPGAAQPSGDPAPAAAEQVEVAPLAPAVEEAQGGAPEVPGAAEASLEAPPAPAQAAAAEANDDENNEENPWGQPAASGSAEVAEAPLEEAQAPSGDAEMRSSPAFVAPSLVELTRALAIAPAEAEEPFEATSEIVVVRVRGEVLMRLEGLMAAAGGLSYVPEMKRFRGRATDKAFGDGERRMVRASGRGTLVLAARERVFVPVELGEESAYFREDAVFAFEESIVFENGRVPSKIAPDLHLVHLRGRGRVLLCSSGPMHATAVISGAPVAIPMAVLLGWHGPLTPRIVGLPEEREGATPVPAVELSGDGYALLGLPRPAAP